MTVKALTVRQPWAWAIIHGGKDVENRTRNIAGTYRGPVAIHAGAGLSEEGCMLVPDLLDATRPDLLAEYADATLTYGAIIGVVDLVDVHPEHFFSGPSCDCGDWAEINVYHLVLTNPRPLTHPIPCRGRLGLWTLPDDITTALAAALEEVKT